MQHVSDMASSTTKVPVPMVPTPSPSLMPLPCCSTCGRTCMHATCLYPCLCHRPSCLGHLRSSLGALKQGMLKACLGCLPGLHVQE